MDLLDIIMEAQAITRGHLQAAIAYLSEARMKQMMSVQWMMLPDEAKELLKQTNRTLYERVISELA